ncbi:MAG: hypothetical protein WCG07_02180 [Candidatus Taylorbacteria bacterium]
MKFNTKIIATTASIITLASIAIPAFANTASTTIPRIPTHIQNRKEMMGSTTRPFIGSTTRMMNLQNRGDNELNKRIASLYALTARIQGMKKLSDADKTALRNDLQQEITSLNALRAKVTSDTSSTTLRADIKNITEGNRVYALVMPKTQILAAADRVDTIVALMNTVGTKIQARLASSTTNPNIAQAQALFADYTAKIADASAQATSAVAEVTSLVPDNGNKTVAASNLAALKDAKKKIQAAQQDIVAARKDLEGIKQILRGGQVHDETASTTESR